MYRVRMYLSNDCIELRVQLKHALVGGGQWIEDQRIEGQRIEATQSVRVPVGTCILSTPVATQTYSAAHNDLATDDAMSQWDSPSR
jgi:hypothetical protein